MSTAIAKNFQIGADSTPSNNFTLYQPASPDGTLRLGNGNTGITSSLLTLTSAGSLNFGATAARITGDFSNATIANRVMFQTSTANSSSAVSVLPSGTSSTSAFQTYNNSDPTNASLGSLIVDSGAISLQSTIRGTGTYLPMTFWTGNSERMRLDTSGNIGIGTSSPSGRVSSAVPDGTTNALFLERTGASPASLAVTFANQFANLLSSGVMTFATNGTERGRFDTSGNFQFNSGYGSVATAFGCRAWVNFNGTGTVAIRASGNVSSITDNGVGDYTVNFTNAMPDAAYAMAATVAGASTGQLVGVDALAIPTQNTGSVRAVFGRSSASPFSIFDCAYVAVTITR